MATPDSLTAQGYDYDCRAAPHYHMSDHILFAALRALGLFPKLRVEYEYEYNISLGAPAGAREACACNCFFY
jgi:hypothetical protein